MNLRYNIFIITFTLIYSFLRADDSDISNSELDKALHKGPSTTVLKLHNETSYAFEFNSDGRRVTLFFLFKKESNRAPTGEFFLRQFYNESSPVPNSLLNRKMSAEECSTFSHMIDYSEVFNLGKREAWDQSGGGIMNDENFLHVGSLYKSIAFKDGKLIIIKRLRGDSMSVDFLFNYLMGRWYDRFAPRSPDEIDAAKKRAQTGRLEDEAK